MRSTTRRSGFTMRDMAVILAVLALFFTAIVPGCNQDTTAARNACRNQMKMQVLALMNHNDTFKTFPPLFFSNDPERITLLSPVDAAECYSWQVKMLPFLEEDALYKALSKASQKFQLPASEVKANASNGNDVVPATISMQHLVCAALPDAPAPGTSNYVALSTTRLPLLLETFTNDKNQLAFKNPPDGMIIPDRTGRGQSMARMADGTSRTAVISESREATRSNWYQPQQAFVAGFVPADSTAAPDGSYYPYIQGANWVPNPASNRTALNYGPTKDKPTQGYHAVAGDPLQRTWGTVERAWRHRCARHGRCFRS